MDIKRIFSEHLQIHSLTRDSLKEAILNRYEPLTDQEKRRINRDIARNVISGYTPVGNRKEHIRTSDPASLQKTNVLAINHSGPLDITIGWKTGPDGTLNLSECHMHSGGDQINVSKVLSDFGQNVALIALAGQQGAEITTVWEKNFFNDNIIPSLIRSLDDQQVAIINMVDSEPLPVMFEWADELSASTVEKINTETMKCLEIMFSGAAKTVWMALSAGGPLRYNSELAYYGTLVKQVKDRYQDKVEFLIDFMHIASPEEAMSVLDIKRKTPQDVIKPNLQEFIQILGSAGLAAADSLDENSITKDAVKEYAAKLREKFNLLGVLVSMDKSGLMLVMRDKVISEKGIKIDLACHTAAGDSLKAGFIYALSGGASFEEAVHTGNLFGASTASMKGTRTVTPGKLKEIEALAEAQGVAPETETL